MLSFFGSLHIKILNRKFSKNLFSVLSHFATVENNNPSNLVFLKTLIDFIKTGQSVQLQSDYQ